MQSVRKRSTVILTLGASLARFGMSRVLAFFRTGTRDDTLAEIKSKFLQAFSVELDEAEAQWLTIIL